MGDNVPSYGNDLETDEDSDWLDFVGERPAAIPKDKAWKPKSLQDSKFGKNNDFLSICRIFAESTPNDDIDKQFRNSMVMVVNTLE